MTKPMDFEIDTNEFTYSFEICWICKNRKKCAIDWGCKTIEDMDHDDTGDGVGEA